MYYYAPDNNRTGRRAGLIAAACYLATFLAVSLFVSFRTEYERPAEGILIDFGDDSDGSGTQNVALSETEEAASRPDTSQEEYLTQETEPAPVITTGSQRQQQTEHTPAEQERQVNRRALFPGRSTSSNASSQGSGAQTAGNRGHESGGDGSSTGTGTGNEGISFDLKGRRAIEITVDAQGRVQNTAFHPQGSTTQDARLLDAALQAARQARFSPSEANAVQTGTITYVFRLQ